MSQKIPLFNGVIAPAAVAAPPGFVTDIFTPPDADSRAPNIYEVHLWVSPREANSAGPPDNRVSSIVRAYEGSNVAGAVSVWRAVTNANVIAHPVVKALDGYPVRGNITLDMLAIDNLGGGEPIFMWGYYRRVGEGPQIQPERRPIAQAPTTPFNAGVPFRIAPGATAIVHVFEPNRIDEISLAAFFETADPLPAANLLLTFEDVNNNVLSTPFVFRPRTAGIYEPVGADPALPPNASLFPPSPYLIHQCPFGGGYLPTLHHIRAWNLAGEGDPDAAVHGYFTRR